MMMKIIPRYKLLRNSLGTNGKKTLILSLSKDLAPFVGKLRVLALILLAAGGTLSAMNLSRPYNPFYKPAPHSDAQFIVSVLAETGIRDAKGFNEDGCLVNPLRILNPDQNGIAMLKGFPEGSPQGQLLDKLQGVDIAPIDNGVRGHFCVDGDLRLNYSLGFGARYFLPLDFSIGAYLPIYSVELKNVRWRDLTPPGTPGDPDARVKEFLTDDFFVHVRELGGLDLRGWRRQGIGDLLLLAEWLRDFPQPRDMLRNVRLNARLGLNFPTGKLSDQDKIFAGPFGSDGAFGIHFGGGLTATIGEYFRTGFTVTLLHLFGHVRNWRIKIDPDQTTLLYLQKACAFKDFGITQQFQLFMQFFNLRGWFTQVDYQFTKHGDDQLSLLTNDFSNEIANSARDLEHWTAHEALIKVGYDFSDEWDDPRIKPTLSLYAKVPFNGKRSALFTTVGVIVGLEF